MKLRFLLLITAAVLPLAGCATHEYYQGGTSDTYSAGNGIGEGSAEPSASPTFRPGMFPYDPRDPHFTNRPEPMQSPSNTKP